MVTALKIIVIPLYVLGMSLLINPLFNVDLDLFGHIVVVIPLTLMTYWQVFYFNKRKK
ncbi:hypothetical protein SAMN05216353_102125 [Halobacillus alkaliphilus]|uniref:Uncharacterized protein n=1 Tax=Halobacillus alkaliphilus TaxID=396056 RepID=A0A1I2JUV3_9BACI|nr:hypothetical protein SAMN05216353_102125 [Halobacillus alkaliphilus]